MILFLILNQDQLVQHKPIGSNLSGKDLTLFKEFLSTEFEDLNNMSIKNESRTRVLNYIIDYYSLHLQMFKTPKSINVFAEIFK